jgi:hypothetical protein
MAGEEEVGLICGAGAFGLGACLVCFDMTGFVSTDTLSSVGTVGQLANAVSIWRNQRLVLALSAACFSRVRPISSSFCSARSISCCVTENAIMPSDILFMSVTNNCVNEAKRDTASSSVKLVPANVAATFAWLDELSIKWCGFDSSVCSGVFCFWSFC